MNWPFHKSKPVAVAVRIISRQATKLRLSEWRADPSLCNQASKFMADPSFQLAVSVLHNEHPAFVVIDLGTSLQDRAVYQARCEGYTLALANLEALSVHQKLHDAPEAEFAPEEIER